MYFPDPNCVASQTISRIAGHGLYALIGADWVAILTVSFHGKIRIDASRDISGVGYEHIDDFLHTYSSELLHQEPLINVLHRGKYYCAYWVQDGENYHVYNLYCRVGTPFDTRDTQWFGVYSKSSLDYTHLKNESIQNQEYDRTALDSIPSAIIAIAQDGRILTTNRAADQFFFAEVPAPHGGSLFGYIPQDCRAKLMAAASRAIRTANRVFLSDLCIHYPPKDYFFNVTLSPLRDSKQRVAGAVLVFEDITAQRLLEMEIAHFEQYGLIGEMAAGLAHDIKNPLMNIHGFTGLIASQPGASAATQEMTNIIKHEVERINLVIEQMLSVNTAASMQHTGGVDFNGVIRSCFYLLERQKFSRIIEFKTDCDPALPLYGCRENTAQQIVFNLLLNALQAIEETGVIFADTRYLAQEGVIRIRICDSGVGIPPEIEGKIFDPHFTTKKHGSGLGLFVVKRIVTQLGGSIRIAAGDEYSTVCTLCLPVGRGAAQEAT